MKGINRIINMRLNLRDVWSVKKKIILLPCLGALLSVAAVVKLVCTLNGASPSTCASGNILQGAYRAEEESFRYFVQISDALWVKYREAEQVN